MKKINLIVQTSLDGFVAGEKGEFDQFLGGDENLGFVCSIIDSADTILLGRISYELLNADWPHVAGRAGATANEIKYSNWYNASSKVVVSKTMRAEGSSPARVISNGLDAATRELKEKPGKDVLIFGSPTLVHSLLQYDLIDGIYLIVHPVFFGAGIPLFKANNKARQLRLEASSLLSNGTICSRYSL